MEEGNGVTKINISEAEEILARLNKEADVTITEFIARNYEKLKNSGLSKKSIYNFYLKNGMNLGNYETFKRAYNRYTKKIKTEKANTNTLMFSKTEETSPLAINQETIETSVKKTEPPKPLKKAGLGLRPIYLPDGTEVEITETGAKRFKVESRIKT